MKKRVFGRKLSRSKSARRALFRGLIRGLVSYGSIKTTKVKAKAVRGEIDKMVSLAKNGSLASRRRVYAKLGNDRKTTDLLFSKVATVFSARKSGFTRIIPLFPRRGDRAEMARLEWTEEIVVGDKKQATGKKATKKRRGNLKESSSKGRTGEKESEDKNTTTKRTLKGSLRALKRSSATKLGKSKKK